MDIEFTLDAKVKIHTATMDFNRETCSVSGEIDFYIPGKDQFVAETPFNTSVNLKAVSQVIDLISQEKMWDILQGRKENFDDDIPF